MLGERDFCVCAYLESIECHCGAEGAEAGEVGVRGKVLEVGLEGGAEGGEFILAAVEGGLDKICSGFVQIWLLLALVTLPSFAADDAIFVHLPRELRQGFG